MKRAPIFLLAGLAFSAWSDETPPGAADPDALRAQAKELRARASTLREEAATTRAAAEKACWEKFLVSSCLEKARAAERDSEREAKLLEIEAGRIERQVRAREHEARLARRQAEKAAEIERRRAERADKENAE